MTSFAASRMPIPSPSPLLDEAATIEVGGRTRTLTVVRPEGGTAGSPVVLVYHGSNQNAKRVRAFAGGTFDRFAAWGGAVVVYLDGYRGNWNDARIGSRFAARQENIDDVAFTKAVINLLVERDRVDPSRVYAVGYSSGGAMVIRLAHAIPDRLAGLGIISATQPVPENFLLQGAPAYPLPTLLIHGTKDRLVPYEGGMASLWGFRPRGLGLSARQTANYFAARNGITAEPGVRILPHRPDSRGTTVDQLDFRQDGRPPVTLYTVHGGGHVIPGPRNAPRIMGRTTHDLVAVDALGTLFGLATGPEPSDADPARISGRSGS